MLTTSRLDGGQVIGQGKIVSHHQITLRRDLRDHGIGEAKANKDRVGGSGGRGLIFFGQQLETGAQSLEKLIA